LTNDLGAADGSGQDEDCCQGGPAHHGQLWHGAHVINGSHVILYSADADADRAFFADVLRLPHVDAGGGWLIFGLPPAEAAVHPAEAASHQLYFMCDDIESTIAELRAKGVEFTTGISEERWGRLTSFKLPGGGEVGMYEPRHPTAADL
jgi:predicted enzyme related to lactoylglutathione lyase